MLQNNDKVMHQDFGIGTILSILPDSVLVRFENNSIQQCPFEDLRYIIPFLSLCCHPFQSRQASNSLRHFSL